MDLWALKRSAGAGAGRWTTTFKTRLASALSIPNAFIWMRIAGEAVLHLGRNEAAALWLNRSITALPTDNPICFVQQEGIIDRLRKAGAPEG
jgi:hypothetical protein